MKIAVGSLNPVKINAVKEVFTQFYPNAEVVGVKPEPGVSEQPFGLEETIRGAVQRAESALKHGSIGIGIEAGLIEIPYSEVGFLDIHFCVIADHERTTIGSSTGFEYPSIIISQAKGGMDVGRAMEELSGIKGIGRKKGAVGYLSDGVLTRKELCRQAILAALIPRMWTHRCERKNILYRADLR